MTKVLLYFGSFNPVHYGHLKIAEKALDAAVADELWFVVSPQNPFKQSSELAPEQHRLSMCELAIKDSNRLKTCDIEFTMPRPSRTIDTISLLREQHPNHEFALLMGSDNAVDLDKWKDHQKLVATTQIYVYPRAEFDALASTYAQNIIMIEGVDLLDFMATDVRKMLEQGISKDEIAEMVPDNVLEYIVENNIYKAMKGDQTIEQLTMQIEQATDNQHKTQLLMNRARAYMKQQQHGNALNDYNAALELEPENQAARQGAIMVKDILEFRYTDIYNP